MEMYFNTTALAIIFGYYILINLVLYITMVIDKKEPSKTAGESPKKICSSWQLWAAAWAVWLQWFSNAIKTDIWTLSWYSL